MHFSRISFLIISLSIFMPTYASVVSAQTIHELYLQVILEDDPEFMSDSEAFDEFMNSPIDVNLSDPRDVYFHGLVTAGASVAEIDEAMTRFIAQQLRLQELQLIEESGGVPIAEDSPFWDLPEQH